MANTITHTNENEIGILFRNVHNKKTKSPRDRWVQHHAKRIHKCWLQWQTPLGVTYKYVEQIKKDIAEFYDDPLKRAFIETTYC